MKLLSVRCLNVRVCVPIQQNLSKCVLARRDLLIIRMKMRSSLKYSSYQFTKTLTSKEYFFSSCNHSNQFSSLKFLKKFMNTHSFLYFGSFNIFISSLRFMKEVLVLLNLTNNSRSIHIYNMIVENRGRSGDS